MNRLLVLTSACLIVASAAAQQPGPPRTNNNQASPVINAPASTPAMKKPANAATPSGPIAPGSSASAPASSNSSNSNTIWSAEPGSTTPPPQPTTEMLPQGATLPSADPYLEPKELPKEDLSLIGGITTKVDKIRNRVEIQPFGNGKTVTVRFDDRSHVYRDGRETTVTGINKGDRIYVDTMLVDGHVFARNLRVVTKSGPAESRGEVQAYDVQSGRVQMQDSLTGQIITFFVGPKTAMERRGKPASPSDLKPGTLLDVMFAPERHGGLADQIGILATPGENFIFAGRVTSLDLSHGVLSMDNETDEKNYELFFPANLEDRDALRVGSEITAQAQFDGKSYHATQLSVRKPASAQQ